MSLTPLSRGMPPGFLLVALAMILCARPAAGQSTVVWTTNYYTVLGATLPEIDASIQRFRPTGGMGRMHGLTTWQIDWRFGTAPTAQGCQVRDFSTQTLIATTLPRWLPPTNATAQVREAWYRYAQALAAHEAGHARIAQAAADELQRRVREIKEAADCAGVQRAIDDLGQRVLADHRGREAAYDRETKHGATQGAVFPHRRTRPR